MKYLFFIPIIFCIFSCKKEDSNANFKENVEISLVIEMMICKDDGCEFPTATIKGKVYKLNHQLPTTITDKPNWWLKDYIGTVEYLSGICYCELSVDPMPGIAPPSVELSKVKILEIREK